MSELSIKTGEALNLYNDLKAFIDKDVELDIQIAWDLEDNYEALKRIADKFEKHKSDILKKLADEGKVIQEDNMIRPVEGHEAEFMEAVVKIEELSNTTNSIDIKKISGESLPKTISTKDLRALKFMVNR